MYVELEREILLIKVEKFDKFKENDLKYTHET
jgi:hypothetical protein